MVLSSTITRRGGKRGGRENVRRAVISAFSFSAAVALPRWLLSLVAPQWHWSQPLATSAAPLLLTAFYLLLLASHSIPPGSGLGSLSQVSVLFQSPFALLAGWIHYVAFDLFIGTWQVRDAERVGIYLSGLWHPAFSWISFGPVRLPLYLLLKLMLRRAFSAG